MSTTNLRASVPRLCTILLAAGSLIFPAARAAENSATEPTMLDVSRFYRERFVTLERTNSTFAEVAGVQVFDGLPFDVRGRGCLFGEKEAAWNRRGTDSEGPKYPDFIGLPVGRSFDELHLLHACRWADVQGQTIAYVRFNYADGTRVEIPLKFGAHVRDWQRLRSEEKETLTDPDSKIVWRNERLTALKGTTRIFKSRFENPYPKKEVATIDFVSTRQMASYEIVAATVANRDQTRGTTPAAPSAEPERHFDGACTVSVTDAGTGRPLAGVLVDPGMYVDETGVIAMPLRTDEEGRAIVVFPKGRVAGHSVRVRLDGYEEQNAYKETEFPDLLTFKLEKQHQQPGNSSLEGS
jgi:hypothetical protein